MTKYKKIYEEMVRQNRELFEEFRWVHDHYLENPKSWQKTFNIVGEKVLEVVRKYEDILCRKTEGGGFAKFSGSLAEKFHQEIKIHFPKIDYIGIENQSEE